VFALLVVSTTWIQQFRKGRWGRMYESAKNDLAILSAKYEVLFT
jgi:hypothetical protein